MLIAFLILLGILVWIFLGLVSVGLSIKYDKDGPVGEMPILFALIWPITLIVVACISIERIGINQRFINLAKKIIK